MALPNLYDTKGTFHTKMSSIKDRNGMDLTEAEDIKKRGQEYTEELYKKNLSLTPIYFMSYWNKYKLMDLKHV